MPPSRFPVLVLLVLVFMTSALVGGALPTKPAPITSYSAPYPTFGRIERHDPSLDTLIAPEAAIEKLAEGFNWSEGPVWVPAARHLLFSDVPENRIYRWSPADGVAVFHAASGFAGKFFDGKEPGSNGLTLDGRGRLVVCQHGERRVARLGDDGQAFAAVAERFDGRRFNSPNDLCFDRAGNLYFTDPPYGVARDAVRDLDFQGVYRVSPAGQVTLLTRELERPNGIALSPDQRTLYVANSHRPRAVVMAFPLSEEGRLGPGRVVIDMGPLYIERRTGSPDGLKIDVQGNLWATGPGGVLVVRPDGKLLGVVLTGESTANCAWGDDGGTLYLTADGILARLRTRTRGTR